MLSTSLVLHPWVEVLADEGSHSVLMLCTVAMRAVVVVDLRTPACSTVYSRPVEYYVLRTTTRWSSLVAYSCSTHAVTTAQAMNTASVAASTPVV